MKELEKGEYLAPEAGVLLFVTKSVLLVSGDLEETTEGAEVLW